MVLCKLVSVPAGCWIRAMVIFASEVVAKQCGAVKRCANHISEDRQSGKDQSYSCCDNYDCVTRATD